jgi:hypothetical protein
MEEVVVMTDESTTPDNLQPTHANLAWLFLCRKRLISTHSSSPPCRQLSLRGSLKTSQQQISSSFVRHLKKCAKQALILYTLDCGHGAQTKCNDGSERDGLEESMLDYCTPLINADCSDIVPSDAEGEQRLIQDNVCTCNAVHNRRLTNGFDRFSGNTLWTVFQKAQTSTYVAHLSLSTQLITRISSGIL